MSDPAQTFTRIGLSGARGGFGRTFLAQLPRIARMRATQLIDPDTDGVAQMLRELGSDETGVSLVAGIDDVDWSALDVLVEATGRIDVGLAYAEAAIAHGVHVVMVSKEIESFAGVELSRKAAAAGVRYLPGDGDQPANLLRLVDWVERVGLTIVAMGKSGEYDLVFDPDAGTVTQLDVTVPAPELADLLVLGADPHATLAARAAAVSSLKRAAAADSCEMAVVSLYTGAPADAEALHYPVARPAELADVYARRADGGLIGTDRSVEVFSMLRLPGEASFAGGVFVIVETGDPVTWQLLEGKGHVVSRDGRYACIFWPYHFMGVETPLTIDAAVTGAPVPPQPRQHTVLAARATTDLAAGTRFTVEGHHHEIAGVAPVIIDRATAADADGAVSASAYYLLSAATLVRDVAAGEIIALADLDGVVPSALSAFVDGFAR